MISEGGLCPLVTRGARAEGSGTRSEPCTLQSACHQMRRLQKGHSRGGGVVACLSHIFLVPGQLRPAQALRRRKAAAGTAGAGR